MQGIGAFLEGQPFIALFLVVGLGYALGRVQVAGFSLGIGAVLFVGLAIGAIARSFCMNMAIIFFRLSSS